LRTAREIRFRLAQQIANVRLLARSPSLPRNARIGELPLPDPTIVANEVETLAERILAHRFPVMGITIETGPEIEWRRDYVNGRVTGTSYFRFVPYLDFEQAGDHKNIWELSRHQHLVVLAQAHLLFPERKEYLGEIVTQLQSWWDQNPFLKGINWASALEVAFRALSWLWIDHLVGGQLPTPVRERLRKSLYRHGHYLERNLSTYFSPNTHLLGEGVALHALGLKFPETRWRALGDRIVREELERQIQPDGSHFEHSTYYHVYALDFFRLHYALAGRPEWLREPLDRMARFLAAVTGPSGELSFLGDDDGGRLFHPYGQRSRFGTAGTLVASRPPSGELFPNSGIAVITRGDLHILIDAGPFGPGGAGHSHSDTLSITIRRGAEEILIDPGTYTYVADPQLRDAFRGSAYHNTIRVDGLDQADPAHPFRWENKPAVRIRQWIASDEHTYLDAECSYRGIAHRRRFLLVGESTLFILDSLSGPGEHAIEQFWHAGEPVSELAAHAAQIGTAELLFAGPGIPQLEQGWRSPAFGAKIEAPVIALRWRAHFPQTCATAFVFSGPSRQALHLRNDNELQLGHSLSVRFPEEGSPAVSHY
jgi:hypothetical protein